MSYARFLEDCDVYVYLHIAGSVECCGCRMNDRQSVSFEAFSDVKLHLDDHRAQGHRVPDYVYENLRADQEAYGDAAANACGTGEGQ